MGLASYQFRRPRRVIAHKGDSYGWGVAIHLKHQPDRLHLEPEHRDEHVDSGRYIAEKTGKAIPQIDSRYGADTF